MTTSERIGWLLAIVICVGLPLLTDQPGLPLAGAGGLAVLAWGGKENENDSVEMSSLR